ncbi:MAG: hypothetical protein LBV71_16080 [Prevotella sp.]|jgi:hypothetical protein|nr:hypothetical protein [Prevotella sp.]
MQLIEFYINDRLIDYTNANDLGIKLSRQIFKPSEFTSKDSQMSYKITIPNSVTNNEIFNYSNVEEVKDKFNYEYTAKVYVDNILIFDGYFMLQEITEKKYIGNLYIPVYKTIKDIFGNNVMNKPSSNTEKNKWLFNMDGASDISAWNEQVLTNFENNRASDCLFPYILYGLIPKISINPNDYVNGEMVGEYTDKNVYDKYARLGYEDIPPAMNVLETIKHMFVSNGLTISGTAFNDDRLKHLYMSYSNPTDYIQEWNYGDLSTIEVNGSWSMWDMNNTFEWQISQNSDSYGSYYGTNILDSNRFILNYYTDTGTNTIYNSYDEIKNAVTRKRNNLSITIPQSGYYKITLSGNLSLNTSVYRGELVDNITGKKFTGVIQHNNDTRNNSFQRSMYEIQVLRDFGEGSFTYDKVVGHYNQPNFPQTQAGDTNQYPKYYPFDGEDMIIDPQTNINFISGLHWGNYDNELKDYNPIGGTYPSNYMFMKNGYSWNNTFSQRQKIYHVYDSEKSAGTDDGVNYRCYNLDDLTNQLVTNDVALHYGKIEDMPNNNYCAQSNGIYGEGLVQSVIWLDKGEHITVAVVGNMGDYKKQSSDHTHFDANIVLIDSVNFDLKIESFRTDIQWNNFDNDGNYDSDNVLSWNDANTFQNGYIDLCKFLPSEVKINDFLDNFCKAFNLNLIQPTQNNFELNVKQTKQLGTSDIVSFEDKFNIKLRTNEPLGLPSEINIKWSIDEEEEGYVASGGYTGNGQFQTGTIGGSVSEQSSTFSYNWYKDIDFFGVSDSVPVISKHEVWENGTEDYGEMQKKYYSNLPIRFFYPNSLVAWNNGNYHYNVFQLGNNYVDLVSLKNEYDITTISILDYENKQYSILNNYFTLITTNNTNYTIIETYLTPEEYQLLNGRNIQIYIMYLQLTNMTH